MSMVRDCTLRWGLCSIHFCIPNACTTLWHIVGAQEMFMELLN